MYTNVTFFWGWVIGKIEEREIEPTKKSKPEEPEPEPKEPEQKTEPEPKEPEPEPKEAKQKTEPEPKEPPVSYVFRVPLVCVSHLT